MQNILLGSSNSVSNWNWVSRDFEGKLLLINTLKGSLGLIGDFKRTI